MKRSREGTGLAELLGRVRNGVDRIPQGDRLATAARTGLRSIKRARRRARIAIAKMPYGDRVNVALSKFALARRNRQLYVPTEQLMTYYKDALHDLYDNGVSEPTYFEAGVFAGDSMATWWKAVTEVGGRFRAFGADSFKGLPESVESDDDGWEEGMFSCPRPVAEWNMSKQGVPLDQVELIEGWFDETLTDELAERVGTVHVAMLDADAYSSTVPVLDFLTPLLADRSWLIFDDWYPFGDSNGDHRPSGVERAFDEWLEQNPEFTPTDQGDYDLVWRGEPRKVGRVLTLDRTGNFPA